HRLARIEPQPPPRLIATEVDRKDVEERMADELHRHAGALGEFPPEGQHRQHPAHTPRHLSDAPAPPGAELRRHEVRHRPAGAAEGAPVEVGRCLAGREHDRGCWVNSHWSYSMLTTAIPAPSASRMTSSRSTRSILPPSMPSAVAPPSTMASSVADPTVGMSK